MGASRFIGRVGGLAVALGVGAMWFTGGVAAAETSSDSGSGTARQTQSTQAKGADSGSPSTTRTGRQNRSAPRTTDDTGSAAAQRNARPAATIGKPVVGSPDPVPSSVEIQTIDVPAPASPAPAQQVAAPAASEPVVQSAPQPVAPVIEQAPPAPTPAPAGTVTDALPGLGDVLDPSAEGGPAAPMESPLSWAVLAAARRQPLAAAATADQTANASITSSLTVDPSIEWGGTFNGKSYEGILVGTLNAFSPLPLTYTVISDPSLGGKLGAKASAAPSATRFSQQGEFFYIPYATALTTPGQTETFKILVAQETSFTSFLANVPIVSLIATPVINLLHQLPLISDLLAPLIGASEVVTFTVSPYALAQDRPTAFTVKVPSFDGLMVSTNYFPATDVATGLVDSAPTVLNGPGLGSPGNTDVSNPYAQLDLFPWADIFAPARDQFGSLTPGLPVLRDGAWNDYAGTGGYNVITWDPRGEFATRDRSLPGLQIDSPFFEARDASALISWATSADNPARSQVKLEDLLTGDPLIGMVGGSYGGGIQWTTAGTDPRVDAIVPQISWNSLISSLYPNTNQFKTGFGTVLLLALVTTGAQINRQIYDGVATGVALGWLSQTSQAVLASAGPSVLVGNINAPTLIFQGMQDVLFELQEAVTNAQSLPATTPVKMVWFCGGHGTCNDPLDPDQDDRGLIDNLKWLDQYVAGDPNNPADTIPAFQWYDQRGQYHFSDLLPYQDGFNLPDPFTTTGRGGLLGLVPIIGGSGPGSVTDVSPVLTIGNGTPAWNAINVTVTPPADSQVVGAPTLNFSYSGLGTSRTVYAQLIDNATGRVLGNLVTPVPVVLDGREHTVSIPMANIGYTTPSGGTLTLQITSSATNFENFTTAGLINIGDISLDLPIRNQN